MGSSSVLVLKTRDIDAGMQRMREEMRELEEPREAFPLEEEEPMIGSYDDDDTSQPRRLQDPVADRRRLSPEYQDMQERLHEQTTKKFPLETLRRFGVGRGLDADLRDYPDVSGPRRTVAGNVAQQGAQNLVHETGEVRGIPGLPLPLTNIPMNQRKAFDCAMDMLEGLYFG